MLALIFVWTSIFAQEFSVQRIGEYCDCVKTPIPSWLPIFVKTLDGKKLGATTVADFRNCAQVDVYLNKNNEAEKLRVGPLHMSVKELAGRTIAMGVGIKMLHTLAWVGDEGKEFDLVNGGVLEFQYLTEIPWLQLMVPDFFRSEDELAAYIRRPPWNELKLLVKPDSKGKWSFFRSTGERVNDIVGVFGNGRYVEWGPVKALTTMVTLGPEGDSDGDRFQKLFHGKHIKNAEGMSNMSALGCI